MKTFSQLALMTSKSHQWNSKIRKAPIGTNFQKHFYAHVYPYFQAVGNIVIDNISLGDQYDHFPLCEPWLNQDEFILMQLNVI